MAEPVVEFAVSPTHPADQKYVHDATGTFLGWLDRVATGWAYDPDIRAARPLTAPELRAIAAELERLEGNDA